MVLLKCSYKKYEVIRYGEYSELLDDLITITNFKENNGQMFVNEYSPGMDYRTLIREFATIDDGFIDSLVICGDVVNKIKNKNMFGIGNSNGGLEVFESKGKYFWGIGDNNGDTTYTQITKHLYDSLMEFSKEGIVEPIQNDEEYAEEIIIDVMSDFSKYAISLFETKYKDYVSNSSEKLYDAYEQECKNYAIEIGIDVDELRLDGELLHFNSLEEWDREEKSLWWQYTNYEKGIFSQKFVDYRWV